VKAKPKPPTIDHRYRRRDHVWRVQSDDRGDFDEIVVSKGGALMLHAEMLDRPGRSLFVDVAGVCMWVHVGRDGKARVTWEEDRRK
jgi:hypothetical protein